MSEVRLPFVMCHPSDFDGVQNAMREMQKMVDANKADAARVEYCIRNSLALDFKYGEHGDCVLVIQLPKTGRYPANFRGVIDAAIAAERDASREGDSQ